MTLPQNVADAVTRLDTACVGGRVMPSDDAWQTIRAHLLPRGEAAQPRAVPDAKDPDKCNREWANGWNECRLAMLAAAPSPGESK